MPATQHVIRGKAPREAGQGGVGEGGGRRGAARGRRAAWGAPLLLLAACMLGGAGAQDVEPRVVKPPAPVPFKTIPTYPYKKCSEIRGEADSTGQNATCIPIEAGELAWCGMITYEACMRVPSPSNYDDQLVEDWQIRTGYWAVEQPDLYNAECLGAMTSYYCYLSFPKCMQGDLLKDNNGLKYGRQTEFYELPLCWSLCMSAEMACLGDRVLAEAACEKAVQVGRVMPDRGDMVCHAAGSLLRPGFVLLLLLAFAAMFI